MRIDFLGRGVQIQSGPFRMWLSAPDVIELMRWCVDHEVELTDKVYELEREPQYSIKKQEED